MIAKYAGKCRRCGGVIQKGEECEYESATKTIGHYNCPPKVDLFSQSEAKTAADECGFVTFDQRETVRWSELRYVGPLK